MSDGFPLPGADQSSYRAQASDLGHVLSVAVTARAADTMVTRRVSSESAVVVAGTLTAATPRILGTVRTGSTISVSTGVWNPVPAFRYQWSADGVQLPGATGPSLLLTQTLQAARISVTVTGQLAGYTDRAVSSNATAAVLSPAPLSHGSPTVSGKAAVGSSMLVNPSTWPAAATLKYQWYAAGVPIAGAIRDRFVPSASELGKRITVGVTGEAPGWPTTRAVSAATAPVVAGTFAHSPKPILLGNGGIGSALRVDPGQWSPPAALQYQWFADGKAVSGATASGFNVSQRHAGQKITVVVTATRSGFTTLRLTSDPRRIPTR
jgi:hypothetical protein